MSRRPNDIVHRSFGPSINRRFFEGSLATSGSLWRRHDVTCQRLNNLFCVITEHPRPRRQRDRLDVFLVFEPVNVHHEMRGDDLSGKERGTYSLDRHGPEEMKCCYDVVRRQHTTRRAFRGRLFLNFRVEFYVECTTGKNYRIITSFTGQRNPLARKKAKSRFHQLLRATLLQKASWAEDRCCP